MDHFPNYIDLNSYNSAAKTALIKEDFINIFPGDITVNASTKDESYRREEAENVLSTVTLIAAMVFFLSFFLAMYAHVKVSRRPLYGRSLV